MGDKSLFQVGNDVEFWRVLVHLSILALCLVFFESALHYVEHHLARYDKYQHMLRKAYRELMILGLISLGLKLFKEVPGVAPDSKTMLAFQVADLTIIILALALILQAIVVFLQLRKCNKLADRTELITAQDLVDGISPPAGTPPTAAPTHPLASKWWFHSSRMIQGFDNEVMERRLLRHLFLRRFGLPQLFPFSKYLRRAQANQISHMIEVEPTMWLLLLAVAWGICGVLSTLHQVQLDLSNGHELVEVFVVFAWGLVLVHIAVVLYFRTCVRHLLVVAGHSPHEPTLLANLRFIAEEETLACQSEAADNALDTMNRVLEEVEEVEDQRNAQRHALLQRDEGLQLMATCCRNINHLKQPKLRTGRAISGAQIGTPELKLRFFSRKAWHVVVMFLFILNGFYIALLVQCALYDLEEISKDYGLGAAVAVPLPLFLNVFVFQQRMFRSFIMICSILRVEATTLGEVITHFSKIVELRSEFATSLLECLKAQDYAIMDLRRELRAYDSRQTGKIDVDNLRTVLCAFGFRLARFRFNTVAKMLFELNGTKVEYGQLLVLLANAQQDIAREHLQSSQVRQHPLLQRSQTTLEGVGNATFRANHANASGSERQAPSVPPSMEHSESPRTSSVNTSRLRRLSLYRVSNTLRPSKTDSRARTSTLESSDTSQRMTQNELRNTRSESAASMDNLPSHTVYTVL
ncbi:hypothetical protein CCR75_008145 [Bremia lactucae]|uniref:EF-hand domain-containing protein n=1 Tax=Bremia lactucae TaxID=4779 RepID=A0A976FFX6_BRELC|nr:hypothetical protein CCR75_008145 [Bremia lactucae]